MSQSNRHSPIDVLLRQWANEKPTKTYRMFLQRSSREYDTRWRAAMYLYGVNVSHQATWDLIGGHCYLENTIKLATESGSMRVLRIPSTSSYGSQERPEMHGVTNGKVADPWGWDYDEKEGNVAFLDLDEFADNVSRASLHEDGDLPVCTCFESLAPLILNHGLLAVLRFISRLPLGLVFAPIDQKLMSQRNQALMEEFANAIVGVGGGKVVVARDGVREKANLTRRATFLRVTSAARGDWTIVDESSFSESRVNSPLSLDVDDVGTSTTSVGRRIKLQVEDDRITYTRTKPSMLQIVENPNFSDFDLEDPDEDVA